VKVTNKQTTCKVAVCSATPKAPTVQTLVHQGQYMPKQRLYATAEQQQIMLQTQAVAHVAASSSAAAAHHSLFDVMSQHPTVKYLQRTSKEARQSG
jgi:hypothetical protein